MCYNDDIVITHCNNYNHTHDHVAYTDYVMIHTESHNMITIAGCHNLTSIGIFLALVLSLQKVNICLVDNNMYNAQFITYCSCMQNLQLYCLFSRFCKTHHSLIHYDELLCCALEIHFNLKRLSESNHNSHNEVFFMELVHTSSVIC